MFTRIGTPKKWKFNHPTNLMRIRELAEGVGYHCFIGDSFRIFREKCRDIITCTDSVATYVLNKSFCPPETLLYVWRNLISPCHYISYRNRHYCTDVWKVLKCDMDAETFVSNMPAPRCCSETGSFRKIYSEMQAVEGTQQQSPSEAAFRWFSTVSEFRVSFPPPLIRA